MTSTRLTNQLAALLLTFALGVPHAQAATRHRARTLRMEATAFALDSKPTAAGTTTQEGIVAADPLVLPLGSRIRISGAGAYNGVYLVTEKGAKIKGRLIDLYLPTTAAAKQFGKKRVTVQILETGAGKQDAREKSPQ